MEEAVRLALQDGLLRWYRANARKMPWRGVKDPYAIFLSEIILQQTRVAQGLPYYERFLEAYPTVEDLAAAHDDDVMRLWQGLGYYSRARNMLKAARLVAEKGWPKTAAGLSKLPGIGAYTSAAIASIAFGEAVPVLDGNVARVLSRWFDDEGDILKPATQARFRQIAAHLLQGANPAEFNQAMMEFGALFCVPSNPPCLACSVRDLCLAFDRRTVSLRPVKAKASAKKDRYLAYIAVQNSDGQLLVKKRTGKGIWQGLYEFFSLEADDGIPPEQEALDALVELLPKIKVKSTQQAPIWHGLHVLSHQSLHITVWQALAPKIPSTLPEDFSWVTLQEWEALGKPVPMVKATSGLSL